jgi:dipeptidyl aminopeptidase/acylaminoacyl peptidase
MHALKAILMASAAASVAVVAGHASAAADGQGTEVVVRGLKRTKPVDTPPALDLYARTPRIEQVALSPDGSQVALLTRADGLRLLSDYRFSDRHHSYYKVTGGTASAMSWADNAHVLISESRLALRGTCENSPGDPGHRTLDAHDIPLPSSVKPDSSDAAALQSQMQLLLDSNRAPDCAYFGIRGENAMTSVNVLTGKGVPIGFHIGDAPSLPLGPPFRVESGGGTRLEGPFLEVRAHSVGSQPAQRAYPWKVDPETGDGQLIDDGGGDIERENRYVDDWLFDRDGTILARAVYEFRNETYRIEMKADGKWKPVLTRAIVKTDNTFAPFLVGISGDGKSIVVLDTEAHGKDLKGAQRHFHYYGLDAGGQLSGPLERGDASQVRPVFSPRTGRLAGFASDGAEPKYDIADPELKAVYDKALAAAPGQTVEVLSVTDDERKALIHVTGGEDTGSYYRIDYDRGQSITIGEDFPQIPTNWIAVQELFTYRAKDGTPLDGILTLPPKPAGKNLPLVVLPHDGPEGQDRFGFDWLAQALASRGYLVLQPNYRGSDGHGTDFVAAGYGEWSGKILTDIADGVSELAGQGLADPHRVCMVGIGYGGYAALKAAEGQDIRCAAAIDAITDPGRYLDGRKGNAPAPDPDAFASLTPSPRWPRTFHADPSSLRSLERFLGDGAPRVSAAAIKVPVLLIHQEGDGLVPVSQSRDLREALRALGKPLDYVELKGGGHAPDDEASRLQVLQSVIAFLASNNPAGN